MGLSDKLKKNLKYIKLKDVGSIFIFLIAYPLSLMVRLWYMTQNARVWLIAESPDTAHDNGYHFFEYITREHPEITAYYAIEPKSTDRHKVMALGKVINYGSFKHWLIYLAADENISTQKSGNPSPPLFYMLHLYRVIRNNRVFLQHGIIYNDLKWLYYNETNFKLIICGAKREYNYIQSKFGYPESSVVYTGLPRYDGLYQHNKNKKQILIMPTWRNWLGRETNILGGESQKFTDTPYFKHWKSLLMNEDLRHYLHSNGIVLYFYPHFNMQKYADLFRSNSKNIKIVTKENADIQDLLKTSSLLITDYSSIFFDFAYMEKPLVYYQFDEHEFRERQYEEGYFSYRKHGFGPVVNNEKLLVKKIIGYINNDYSIEKKYSDNSNSFFQLRDRLNSQRVYEAIVKSERGDG